MADLSPAQEIQDAAELIRTAAEKASCGPWVFYQTVTRDEDNNDVAWTITRPYCDGGSPGDCDPDCAKDVLQVGAEGCEHDFVSQGDVEWMTLVSPSIAEPLADLLDAIADGMDEFNAVEGSSSKAVHPVTALGLGAPYRSWTSALATARVINGSSS